MQLIVDWAGNTKQTTSSKMLWSSKGGLFTSTKGVSTYFPLPLKYRGAVTVIGTHKVTPSQEGRPDLLAKYLYDNEDYWWLIYWMSGIIDPFSGPKAGEIIYIADLAQIDTLLG